MFISGTQTEFSQIQHFILDKQSLSQAQLDGQQAPRLLRNASGNSVLGIHFPNTPFSMFRFPRVENITRVPELTFWNWTGCNTGKEVCNPTRVTQVQTLYART